MIPNIKTNQTPARREKTKSIGEKNSITWLKDSQQRERFIKKIKLRKTTKRPIINQKTDDRPRLINKVRFY